ncbi:MAG: aminotransferase class V-fold PLP-dependent enzyme, partial [Bacteroidia bacterium]
GSAIDYLTEIGLSHIQRQEHELLLYATERMKELPFVSIIGNAVDKGAIISFVVDGVHPLDIGTLLDLKGIALRTGHHCAQPLMQRLNVPGTARASFAFYNTKSEIDYFIEALRDAIAVLR